MSEKTYQGWANYETWCVKLWIDNEEPSYRYWKEQAQDAWEESEVGGNRFVKSRMSRAEIILADRLKDEFDSSAELPELPGLYSDLLNAALSEVNWDEIAKAMLEEIDTDEEEDDAEAE